MNPGETTKRGTVCKASGKRLGRRYRVEAEDGCEKLYVELPFRVGLVLGVATDGKPWTIRGVPYYFRHSAGWTRFAFGKYAAGILWRIPKKQEWRCRRCKADVIDGRCECTESPSPWEPKL